LCVVSKLSSLFPEPDLTGGDGIYGSYLSDYPLRGRYEFEVEVSDNGRKAFYFVPQNKENEVSFEKI